MFDVNLIAVLVASLAVFGIGGPWYGPLFGKAWERAVKTPPSKTKHPAKVFALAFIFGLISALVIAVLAGPQPTFEHALMIGIGVGVAGAAAFGINYQFADQKPALLAIDGAYTVLMCAAMGAIIGAFG